jgi:hypothetical protein
LNTIQTDVQNCVQSGWIVFLLKRGRQEDCNRVFDNIIHFKL